MGNGLKFFGKMSRAYPHIVEGVIGLGQIAVTMVQVFLQSFGTVVILAMLAIVEVTGIESGLWFLDGHGGVAWLSAIALVTYNMLIDTMIVNIEHEAGYEHQGQTVASLRILAKNLGYRVGYGDAWEARAKSPAHSFYQQRRLITFTVFLIALSGRMELAILEVSDVPFGEGVELLVQETSVRDVFTWLSGITLTMASLLGVQRLTHYTAKQVIVIKAEQKQKLTNQKRSDTRRQNRQGVTIRRDTTDVTSHDRRDTDATRGSQALSQSDALDLLRRNRDVIRPGKTARRIAEELHIDERSLRTVQRALKVMRQAGEIE